MKFNNDMPQLSVDIDTSMPLSLILNELITNSFKHAFTQVAQAEIRLGLELTSPNRYLLSYHDNGPGLPANLNYNNARTLGLRLLKNLSAQLDGTFSYDRTSNDFLVEFRLLDTG